MTPNKRPGPASFSSRFILRLDPARPLLAAVARRVADPQSLRLLTGWRRAPGVVERADGKRETRGGRRTRRGTPQGGAISPVLANVYLHQLDTVWRGEGLERRLQARLIRYADDFVVRCKRSGEQVRAAVTGQLQGLGRALNPAKTRVLEAQREALTLLGFTVRLARRGRTGGRFALIRPSADAGQRLRDKVKTLTGRHRAPLPTPEVIAEVNRVVQGWAGDLPLQALRAGLQQPPAIRRRAGPDLPPAEAWASDAGVPGVSQPLPLRAPRPLSPARCPALVGGCACLAVKVIGQPCAGKPHTRLDEGALASRLR